MSLPDPWIDKIFTKLTLAYGREFIGRWEGLELAAVKTDWGHELAAYAQSPHAIAFALQNLPPDRPPTVLQFRAICRQAKSQDVQRLPEPPADPARVAAELAKLVPIAKANAPAQDGKAWARRIIERHEAGEKLTPIAVKFAQQALNRRAPARLAEEVTA